MRDKLYRHLVQILLGIMVVGFFMAHASNWVQAPFIDRLDHLAYDARLNFTMPGGVDDRVVIIDIDEKSLQAEGRWPWSRDKVARLLEVVFDDYGCGLLGFDIVFAEPDNSSGLDVLEGLASGELKDVTGFSERLAGLRPRLDYDRLMADALGRYPVVLGYYFTTAQGDDSLTLGTLPPPSFTKDTFARRSIPFMRADGYGGNLPQFQAAALGAGHFTPAVDSDGVIRKVPMLYEYDGNYYAALSLTMARLAAQVEGIGLGFPPGSAPGAAYQGMEWLQLGERTIPIDEAARALVPYRGRQGSFPYVSATDLLNGRVPKDMLRNRIALVGTTAPGLLDLRATPVQKVYPGVEVHANLIAGILAGSVLEDPAYTLGIEFLALALCGLALAVALPILSPAVATGVTVAALAGYTAVNLWIWTTQHLVLALVPGLLMVLMLYLLNVAYGYFVESRGRRQLAGLFGQYVPPELVDEMSVDPGHYSMDARSREVTVLFTDVRNFTTISEGMEPQQLSELMSEFLTPMTEIIHRTRGTIDKYMGDAVMCFWGAPIDDAEHERHALEAAVEMVDTVARLSADFQSRGWPELRIGVGINTGVVSVGDMGSRFRRAYTVLGDAVNLASRLEGQTKNYGVDIIVGEATRTNVRHFVFRELDRIRVKGKHEPVTIYEPFAGRDDITDAQRQELKRYRQALEQYRAQSWDTAEIQFVNLANASPGCRLYQLYMERISAFRNDPPGADWDGVFTSTSK